MSTGYSGNLGFPLPSNWAYDQIKEYTFGSGGGAFPLDKDVRRSTAPQVASSGVERTPFLSPPPAAPAEDVDGYWRWSTLQYAADMVRQDAYVDVGAMNDIMLLRLQKPQYWVDGSSPAGELRYFWSVIYTPEVWNTPTIPSGWTVYFEGSYNDFDELLEGTAFPLPVDGQLGDLDHFAASTRGYLNWGRPSVGDDATYGDFGAWGLDLITMWRDYEVARLASPGGVLDVAAFMAANLGINNELAFGAADLKADAAAFLTAKQIAADGTRSLADIIRVLYNNIEDDSGYLATEFQAQRFGTRSQMVNIAKSMFTQPWPNDFIISTVFPTRFPGQVSTTEGYNNPDAEVLETELQAVAEAFADAVENAQS